MPVFLSATLAGDDDRGRETAGYAAHSHSSDRVGKTSEKLSKVGIPYFEGVWFAVLIVLL